MASFRRQYGLVQETVWPRSGDSMASFRRQYGLVREPVWPRSGTSMASFGSQYGLVQETVWPRSGDSMASFGRQYGLVREPVWPRSGDSIVASLLNAHPNMVVSNEYQSVLEKMDSNTSKQLLFNAIYRMSIPSINSDLKRATHLQLKIRGRVCSISYKLLATRLRAKQLQWNMSLNTICTGRG